jgi:hypothetical protein
MALMDTALAAGIPFRTVFVACLSGDSAAFEGALFEAGLPDVVGSNPSKGTWARENEPHTPQSLEDEFPSPGWNRLPTADRAGRGAQRPL